MLGTLSMVLASTIVNVAIPDIMGSFGMDQSQAQWLATGFLAAMTATMLANAWAVESFGQRGTYIAAMVVFIVASIIGGIAPNEYVLIFSRVVQGAMAGIIQPLAMITIFQVFPEEERGRGMGIYGLGVIIGPALGPALGGVLVDIFSWRAVFFIALPSCLLAVFMGLLFLPERLGSGRRPNFDWTGFALLTVALTSLLWAFSNGQRLGWSSGLILFLLWGGVAAAVAFVFWQLHNPKPLLNLRVYTSYGFVCGSLLSFALGAALFGTTYLIPLFVQEVQGFTATWAGLVIMPAGLVMAAIFPLAGYLSDRAPAHQPIIAGLLFLALSCFLMARADVNAGFWLLAFWIVLSRLGLGLMMPPIGAGSLRTLPMPMLPQGSGAINFARQLGGAFGVNLMSVALARRTEFHTEALAQEVTAASRIGQDALTQLEAIYARTGVPETLQPAAALEFLGRMIHLQGYTRGFQDTFIILGFVFVLALLPAWLMGKAPRAPARG
ncbi:MFS transporter [Alkalilimnicola ehrlichii]|uniref:MFS transporter n=2 Tax=Alkalilimnicola ehrlichii TaxID=351052 RepID=A0A3E0X3L0_9GAMM|nr:MFS transporter [Alkalilimnicola ehrlichii]